MQMLSISDVSEELGRSAHRIRMWEREGRLPEDLLPLRDHNNRRFWTAEQVEELKQWLIDEDMRPGKGLEEYNRGRS